MIEIIVAIAIAIVAPLIVEDVSKNISKICYWLVCRAASLAPIDKRSRLREEWAADIDETSGVTIKIMTGVGFFVAALRLRATSFRVPAKSNDEAKGGALEPQVDPESVSPSWSPLDAEATNAAALAFQQAAEQINLTSRQVGCLW